MVGLIDCGGFNKFVGLINWWVFKTGEFNTLVGLIDWCNKLTDLLETD